MTEFREWPKIPRGANETICITEKMDGSNACVIIELAPEGMPFIAGVQSRKRLIYPNAEVKDGDNFGFAQWVADNTEDLLQMGEGYHYGEWTGPGIQKNPHCLTEKKFFLFNTARWNDDNPNRPDCCDVVPMLYLGTKYELVIEEIMGELHDSHIHAGTIGEGIIVWYNKTRRFEKYTFENENGKWSS